MIRRGRPASRADDRRGCCRCRITSHHALLPDGLTAMPVGQPRHDGHAAVDRRTNFRTALAKPSFSLLSVTALACALTSSLALPIAIEKPLLRNMRTSFGMSPMV